MSKDNTKHAYDGTWGGRVFCLGVVQQDDGWGMLLLHDELRFVVSACTLNNKAEIAFFFLAPLRLVTVLIEV